MLISHSSGGCTIHDLGASWFSSGESSLPSLQMVVSLLCPHMTEWRSSGVSSSSYKGDNPIVGVFTSWSHLNWFISQSPYLQILSCLGLGFHHLSWGGGYTSTQAFLVAQWWRIHLQCRRCGFSPWIGKIPWRRKWQPTLVFLEDLVGLHTVDEVSKESDTT